MSGGSGSSVITYPRRNHGLPQRHEEAWEAVNDSDRILTNGPDID
jgi:hypothetical protein